MKQYKKYGIHLLWILPVAFLLETALRRMAEPDLFFYYALVEHFLKTHDWPTTDPFLYTTPDDVLMTAHQWLGYWLYYIPYQLLGWPGPILLKTALVSVFFCIPLIPYWTKRIWPPVYFVLVWTIAIFIAHHRFRERVSIFGDFFVLVLVCGLLWWREKKWFWYMLPAMFLLWTQMHPSWPLAWFILGAFFLTQSPAKWQKHWVICAGLCLVAPLFNPLLLDGYLYPFIFARDVEPYLRQYVVEWLPLTDSRLFGYRFLYFPFFTLMPFGLWRLWEQRRQAAWFEWIIFVLAVALNVKSVRFGLVAQGLFLALVVNHELRRPLLRDTAFARLVTIWVVLALSVSVIFYKEYTSGSWRLSLSERLKLETGYFPQEAVDALDKAKPKMHVFNSFGFGGYLAWRWQGDPKIFFHGFSTNFEFYEQNYNRPQLSREELDRVIYRFDIGVFLISKLGNDNAFIEILRHHPDFQLIREDGAAVIYAKKDPRVFQ